MVQRFLHNRGSNAVISEERFAAGKELSECKTNDRNEKKISHFSQELVRCRLSWVLIWALFCYKLLKI
jgi:hypothetical protein